MQTARWLRTVFPHPLRRVWSCAGNLALARSPAPSRPRHVSPFNTASRRRLAVVFHKDTPASVAVPCAPTASILNPRACAALSPVVPAVTTTTALADTSAPNYNCPCPIIPDCP